ncbi:MAG: Trp family transcriptional regulator [Patescibacteria group bacterium]
MTRISKQFIKEEIITKLYRLFFEVFSRSNNQRSFLSLIDEILSPSEKIMIAKRLGMIYLLIKGVDYRTIAETLKVSTATVLFYSVVYKEKRTQITDLIEQMLKKEKVLNFLEDLFADLTIHPGIYIGHHKLKWEHEKKKEERKTLPV